MVASAEPAVLTFLIADVRGYTRFTVEHGDEAAARLATTFAEITTAVVEPAGGRVIELRGDEALAVFPSVRQALRVATQLQERFVAETREDLPLRVGIGIDAGEAIPVEGGYRGAALNLAARLCSLAGPGEILTSETVTNLARKMDGLEYRQRGTAELKGFTAPVAVMRVVAAESPTLVEAVADEVAVEEQRLPIGGFLGALPFNTIVARDDEMTRILGSVQAVQNGEGRMVLLTGEPGVGKTRLAQEVTLLVRNAGFVIASGRCYEPEVNVPYYPFREALAMLHNSVPATIRADVPRSWPYLLQLLPGQEATTTTHVDAGEDQQRLFYAVGAFMAAVAADHPVALLLDDLHWADDSSLKLLQAIARRTRAERVLIVGTYRDVEVGRHHPLERALQDLNREGLTDEIAVRRLDRAGTAELTATTFGEARISDEFADLLHKHTEGNPFFTHEVLRALVERGDLFAANGRWERRELQEIEVPKSVRSAVGERVSRLAEEAQRILAQASVLGQTFSFDDLGALTEQSEEAIEDALDAAIAAGLARTERHDTYAFTHALTQQVLYDEMSPRRRRRLHLAAGEALEAGRHPEQRTSELAWHFLQADEAEKALHYSLLAGDEACAIFAHAEAIRHFQTALELARELGDRTGEIGALHKLGTSQGRVAAFEEAVKHLKAADRLAVDLGDREVQRRSVAEAQGIIDLQHGTDPDVSARYNALLLDDEPSEGLALLYLAGSRAAFRAGHYEESGELATRMGEIARAIGSDYYLADAELRRGTAMLNNNPRESLPILERALELAEATGNLYCEGNALNNLSSVYSSLGDPERSLHYIQLSLRKWERHGTVLDLMWSYSMNATTLIDVGNLSLARQYSEKALDLARAHNTVWYTAYALLTCAWLKTLIGDWNVAESMLAEGRRIAERYGDRQGIAVALSVQGELDLLRGNAKAVVDAYRDVPVSQAAPLELAFVVQAHLMLGDTAAAEELATQMHGARGADESSAHRVRGLLAAGQTDWDVAETEFLRAIEAARQRKSWQQEGLALHDLGLMLEARGDRDGAMARLTKALRVFRDVGAHAYGDRTERALAKLP